MSFARPATLLAGLMSMAGALLAAPARAVTWARPVAGGVTRSFSFRGSPFAAGQHRGVDLAAPPGAVVGAPCDGRVVVAARIGSSRGVVTIACGRWRASVLPLGRLDVRRGATVAAGDRVGAAGTSSEHDGLHFGVRRAARRFGYVDPMRFLPRRTRPPLGPAPRGDASRRAPPGAATAVPATPAAAHAGPPLASWPAWAGVASLLAALAGGLVRRGARARTARVSRPAAPGRAPPRSAPPAARRPARPA